MDSGDGIELLLDAGLDRRVVGSDEVEITAGDGHWSRWQVLLLRHSPSPREIDRAIAGLRPQVDGLLFVVARVGGALARAAAHDRRIAYAAVDDAVVSFAGQLHRAGEEQPGGRPHVGRTSWTRLAMLRIFALLPAEPLSQSEIARRLGVSHVAVGKQLPLPRDLVDWTTVGWRVVDRGACWDRFLVDYPGPRGLSTYWAATGDLANQLRRIELAALERGDGELAISGDFAADFYAPWRRPNRLVAYVQSQPELQKHGFATVRIADASVELHTPRDRTVLAMSRTAKSTKDVPARRYTDPLIAAWDLLRSPGGDVESAVRELRARALRTPLWS